MLLLKHCAPNVRHRSNTISRPDAGLSTQPQVAPCSLSIALLLLNPHLYSAHLIFHPNIDPKEVLAYADICMPLFYGFRKLASKLTKTPDLLKGLERLDFDPSCLRSHTTMERGLRGS